MTANPAAARLMRPALLAALLFAAAAGAALGLLAFKVFSVPETAAPVSAAQAFNAGNEAYSKNQYGLAAWNYARALLDSPRDSDALQNMAAAQKAAGLPPRRAETAAQKLAAFLGAGAWIAVACAGFWGAVLVLLAMGALRWRGAIPAGLLILCACVCGTGAVGAYGALEQRAYGVAVAKAAALRVAPARQSPVAGALAEAQFARIMETRGTYARVRTESGKTLWVSLDDFYPLY